jgi:hypothetical protein
MIYHTYPPHRGSKHHAKHHSKEKRHHHHHHTLHHQHHRAHVVSRRVVVSHDDGRLPRRLIGLFPRAAAGIPSSASDDLSRSPFRENSPFRPLASIAAEGGRRAAGGRENPTSRFFSNGFYSRRNSLVAHATKNALPKRFGTRVSGGFRGEGGNHAGVAVTRASASSLSSLIFFPSWLSLRTKRARFCKDIA